MCLLVCVQRTVDRALALDPYDAFGWVIRGRWSYEVRPLLSSPLLSSLLIFLSHCTHLLLAIVPPCPPPRPALLPRARQARHWRFPRTLWRIVRRIRRTRTIGFSGLTLCFRVSSNVGALSRKDKMRCGAHWVLSASQINTRIECD